MMAMKPEELRQLRAWALEIVIGKAATQLTVRTVGEMPSSKELVAEAKVLVNYVRSSTGQ